MRGDVDAISIWDGDGTVYTHRGSGEVGYSKIFSLCAKIPVSDYKKSEFPRCPEGWMMTITTVSGSHVPKRGAREISAVRQSNGYKRLILTT